MKRLLSLMSALVPAIGVSVLGVVAQAAAIGTISDGASSARGAQQPLRYVVSGGDASQVQAAKNTILYSLVGIIIAILAYAAVNFVINSFVPTGTTSDGSVNGSSSYGSSTQ